MPITPAGYRPPPAAGPPSVRPARAPAWRRSAGGKREQGGARGRPEEWYVERRETHTWRRKGCEGEGKGRREEWNTGRSGAERKEEHNAEGEPGSGWRIKRKR